MQSFRLFVPLYGARPATDEEIGLLLSGFNVKLTRPPMDDVAILSPPFRGFYRLSIQDGLHRDIVRYVKLHEVTHVVSADIEEPTYMRHDGPLPMSEDAADLTALLGIIPTADIEEGGEWLEDKIRQLVPLEDYGWQKYRIPRLAKKLPRVREMVKGLHGFF